MKIERDDLTMEVYQAIAETVEEKLRRLLMNSSKQIGPDVFNKKGLAEYLHVSESTINKLVMNKQIPHFKIQSGQSGGVRFRQSDIDKWIKRQTIPEMNPVNNSVRVKLTS